MAAASAWFSKDAPGRSWSTCFGSVCLGFCRFTASVNTRQNSRNCFRSLTESFEGEQKRFDKWAELRFAAQQRLMLSWLYHQDVTLTEHQVKVRTRSYSSTVRMFPVSVCSFSCVFSCISHRVQSFCLNTWPQHTTHCVVMDSMLVRRDFKEKWWHTERGCIMSSSCWTSILTSALLNYPAKEPLSAPSVLLHIVASGVNPQ